MSQIVFFLSLVGIVFGLPNSSQEIVGSLRVQALSQTLIRIELLGQLGFEDRPTFTAVQRQWQGIPFTSRTSAGGFTTLVTDFYRVVVPDEQRQAKEENSKCSVFRSFSALKDGVMIGPGIPAVTRDVCCESCLKTAGCAAWEWSPLTGDCFLMQTGTGIVAAADRTLGFAHPETGPIEIRTADGSKLLHRVDTLDQPQSLLDFPSPATVPTVFTLRDSPRFVPPDWGATPMPDWYHGPCRETNGFDLRNDAPDAYFFVTGGIPGFKSFRKEFLRLTGPVPALPDFAFGTWFSWYHSYSETTAMEEVERFKSHNVCSIFFTAFPLLRPPSFSDFSRRFRPRCRLARWESRNGIHR